MFGDSVVIYQEQKYIPFGYHPLRADIEDVLHSRPFPTLTAPAYVLCLVIKRPVGAAIRDKAEDMQYLQSLLDRHGATFPKADATHYFGTVGDYRLKWESHNEFVTYTFFCDGLCSHPFDPVTFDVFPKDWMATAPERCVTSILINVEEMPDEGTVKSRLINYFVPESLAVSEIFDRSALIAGDFRIDKSGHIRFSVFVSPEVGEFRVGRIVQRLCEIETYKSMSMLGFARTRHLIARLGKIDLTLSSLVEQMAAETCQADATLASLMPISAELENLIAQTSYRFGATKAYETIVNQRIQSLRELRFKGRQTFAEFMLRRFDPAMRTVRASEHQLNNLAKRASAAGELLRTRVDVERSAQNQRVLSSMERRVGIQLQLQKMVEGFSVIAISYYSVSLVANMVWPVANALGLDKKLMVSVITPLVVLTVWLIVRKIRRSLPVD